MKTYCKFLILLVFAFSSCKKTSLDTHDYIQWVEDTDNGLNQTKTIGNHQFTVQYKPIDYHLIQIYNPDQMLQFSPQQIDSLHDIYKNQLIFNFRIDRCDGLSVIMTSDNPSNFSNHFIFNAEKDFYLLNSKDTIHPAGYHFERTYEVVPYINLGLVFSVSDDFNNSEGFSFVYDDSVLNTGKIKFKYSNKQIQSIPKLKL